MSCADACSRRALRGYPSRSHCRTASAGLASARAAGSGQRASQAAWAGSTRLTGVCWSMNSLTMMDHGVAPVRRHGRSLAWSAYQRRIATVYGEAIGARSGLVMTGSRIALEQGGLSDPGQAFADAPGQRGVNCRYPLQVLRAGGQQRLQAAEFRYQSVGCGPRQPRYLAQQAEAKRADMLI